MTAGKALPERQAGGAAGPPDGHDASSRAGSMDLVPWTHLCSKSVLGPSEVSKYSLNSFFLDVPIHTVMNILFVFQSEEEEGAHYGMDAV